MCQPVGGPPMLARLASDTGGRFTYNTNDLTLGYARAQRDLACRYALGFYDRLDEGQLRRMNIRVLRPGLRALSPASYKFRKKAKKSESMIRSAFLAPEMFSTGVLRAHAFPLRPHKSRGWETILVISFPVEFDEPVGGSVDLDFGAVLQVGQTVKHSFNRRMTLLAKDLRGNRERQVTFVEFVDLKPGKYTMRTVLSDPATGSVDAAKTHIDVPKVPKVDLLLVPTILGRRAEEDVVVAGNISRKGDPANDRVGSRESFQPLMVQEAERAAEFLALTRACTRQRRVPGDARIDRNVTSEETGGQETDLEAEILDLREQIGRVRCHNLLDELPPAFFDPGRYIFETLLESAQQIQGDDRLRFAVAEGKSEKTD